MAAYLDYFSTYVLIQILQEQVPTSAFFKNRYFPTNEGDIFRSDKVLTEYRDGDRMMAAFVAPRVGDIPIERSGYSIHEYSPAYIAPSRLLTLDELKKRGFGEAIFANVDEQVRAIRIIAQDLIELDARISRREEWMAVQTMIENGCTMQEYIDATTKGEKLIVKFYDGETSGHTYTVAKKWNEAGGSAYDDIKEMARQLSIRGLAASDLVLGSDAHNALLRDEMVVKMLDRNIAFNDATVSETMTDNNGVTYTGTLNFGGFNLAVFCVNEEFKDETGVSKKLFPSTSAMVTAPGCGHMMYGQITQIDIGKTEYTTYAKTRVPKAFVDQNADTRKIRIASRPLAAPKNKNPYIYAANVVA